MGPTEKYQKRTEELEKNLDSKIKVSNKLLSKLEIRVKNPKKNTIKFKKTSYSPSEVGREVIAQFEEHN